MGRNKTKKKTQRRRKEVNRNKSDGYQQEMKSAGENRQRESKIT
jgi:hypothetical protein